MPHASHRIDVLVVAHRPDQIANVQLLKSTLVDWGVDARGKVQDAGRLIEGGCQRVWVDVPGRLMLYANQSGGFHVRCPDCSTHVAAAFGRAHLAWKRGGPRSMSCPSCERMAPLEDWQMHPMGAFSRWAIVFAGAVGTRLTEAADSELKGVVGDYRVVVRRP